MPWVEEPTEHEREEIKFDHALIKTLAAVMIGLFFQTELPNVASEAEELWL